MVGSGNSILEDIVITSCLFEDITLLPAAYEGEEWGSSWKEVGWRAIFGYF